MKEEKVTFKNSKEQKLAGILYTPNRYTATIIFVNGIGTTVSKNRWQPHIPLFTNNNYRVLIFDNYGRGESDGEWEEMNMTTVLNDLKAACDFTQTDKIALIGESFGGGASLLCAPKDSRVKAITLLYAAHNMDAWQRGKWLAEAQQKGYAISRSKPDKRYPLSIFEGHRKYQILKQVPKVKVPLLITHGDADNSIPLKQANEIYDAANKPKKLVILKGEPHVYTDAGFKKAFKETLSWFNKYLK